MEDVKCQPRAQLETSEMLNYDYVLALTDATVLFPYSFF